MDEMKFGMEILTSDGMKNASDLSTMRFIGYRDMSRDGGGTSNVPCPEGWTDGDGFIIPVGNHNAGSWEYSPNDNVMKIRFGDNGNSTTRVRVYFFMGAL